MAEAHTASATPSIGGVHIRGYVEAEDEEKIGELTAAVERFLRV